MKIVRTLALTLAASAFSIGMVAGAAAPAQADTSWGMVIRSR
jgi:hypothetical protein